MANDFTARVAGISVELGMSVQNKSGIWCKPTVKMDIKIDGGTNPQQREAIIKQAFDEVCDNIEKTISEMRSQGAKDNPTLAQLGIMQSSNSVKIDDLVLNAEDLYIADYLVAGYTRQIKVPYVSGVSVDTTQSNGFASKDNPDPDTRAWKQSQITYTDGLKAGDMVLVQKLNDNNKYVIIARVVEA